MTGLEFALLLLSIFLVIMFIIMFFVVLRIWNKVQEIAGSKASAEAVNNPEEKTE